MTVPVPAKAGPSPSPTWFVWLIIILEGYLCVAVEILVLRQLLPFTGNSVVITSLVIGVFLLCLAAGYYAGHLAEHDHLLQRLQRNFTIALVFFGVGLSTEFMVWFFNSLDPLMNTLWLTSAFLMVVIAPLIFLLGQTLPLCIAYLNRQSHRHHQGIYLCVSTIGSFIGAVGTSLVLFNTIGVARTIALNCLGLFVLIALCRTAKWRRFTLMAGVLLLLVGWLNCSGGLPFMVQDNAYGSYQVATKKGTRYLLINHSASSKLDADGHGWPYIEQIKTIIQHQQHCQHCQILVLGAGGFTLSLHDQRHRYTYVDVDPQIHHIVKRHFLTSINGRFVADDARHFLRHHPRQYDVIVGDTYQNRMSIPEHLMTQGYFQSMRQALRPGGLVVLNIIAAPNFQHRYERAINQTVLDTLSPCLVQANSLSQPISNILYVCRPSPRVVYRDNQNTSSEDYFQMMHHLRDASS
jgi:predicted membrane-bound spermidine synthase